MKKGVWHWRCDHEQMKSIFDQPEFKPYQATWNARQSQFRVRASYADGSIYQNLNWLVRGLPLPATNGIKALYLPLKRAVNIDAGIVPNGWALDPAMPAALTAARDKVFDGSRWRRDGQLYVHHGALFGNVGLRVSDLRADQRIIISPVSPLNFMLAKVNLYSDQAALAFFVETRQNEQGKDFEYAEVITSMFVETFADGEPRGFADRESRYANALGEVPFVEVVHSANGTAIGDCCFQDSIVLLDNLNAIATNLANVTSDLSDPQWAVVGVDDGDLKKGGGNIWYLPPGADVKVLVPNVDIAGLVSFIEMLSKQVEKSLPELAFDEITAKTAIATSTVELQLLELILTIQRVRPNYDAGLVAALRIAGRAAKTMNLSDISILDDPALALDAKREILPLSDLRQAQIDKPVPTPIASPALKA
jgi:hypothetical protein